jgi:DNA-binding XRE family transcriptional regulator
MEEYELTDLDFANAPEGIPEGSKIMHRSGTYGTAQIRGNNIRIRRIGLGLTQEKLAAMADIAKVEKLHRLEMGVGNPHKILLQRIASALGCTAQDLEKV